MRNISNIRYYSTWIITTNEKTIKLFSNFLFKEKKYLYIIVQFK